MTTMEARTAVEEAAQTLGLRGVLDVLATYTNDLLEAATTDKVARARLASDFRQLVNTAERMHN